MKELIMQAQKGDAEAFIRLMESNKYMLYKIAKGYLKREDDIADAMQETMLAAFEHIGKLENYTYFKTWLTRILINKCIDIFRREKRMIPAENVREQIYINHEQNQLEFMQLLELLPKESRAIFLLYYGEGFSIRDIAEILKMNENTTKTRLSRGRKRLAQKIQME